MAYLPITNLYESPLGVNSSDTPLAGGAFFTGTAEEVDYPDVMVTTATDQNGVLYLEFSADGTNWDTSLTFQYNTARINPPHILVKGSRFFRARFENTSATLQTYFRLTTQYGSFNKLTSPINATIAENYDATSTRPTDYRSEVAMNKRQGRSLWNKFGYNADIDIGTELVASFGGTFTPLTTATTLDIVSTDANDIVTTGTGVQKIVVFGIDENRDELTEVVDMNGLTTVTTSSTWLGINRVAMFLVGTNQSNVGTINVTATTGGSTMAQMPAGGGVTQQCIFHIPANHNFLAEYLSINVLNSGKNAELQITALVYSAVNNGIQEVLRLNIDTAKITEPININPSLPFPISEKSVFWLNCSTDTDNIIVNGRFSGILERIL